jgi:hypothetical protein
MLKLNWNKTDTFTMLPSGGPEIAYAEFLVRCDARAQAYFDHHPTFSKDVWPAGLIILGDWMWAVKYLEVNGKRRYESMVADVHTGGQITIIATFCRHDGHGWFVPLVNWANSHIPDQRAARIAENPAAMPSLARVSILRKEAAEQRHY